MTQRSGEKTIYGRALGNATTKEGFKGVKRENLHLNQTTVPYRMPGSKTRFSRETSTRYIQEETV
jgi:hypothetical protein